MGLVLVGPAASPCQDIADLVKGCVVDDRRMRSLIGDDPLRVVVPPHLGDMAKRDVVDVQQDPGTEQPPAGWDIDGPGAGPFPATESSHF